MLVFNPSTQNYIQRTVNKMQDDAFNAELVQGLMAIARKHDEPAPITYTDSKGNTATLPDNYRRLQTLCKDAGLKASGKKSLLMARLARHHAGASLPEDIKTKAVRKPKATKLTYREAQATIKYWTSNGFNRSKRNSGWDNILAIALEFDDQNAIERTCNSSTEEHKAMVHNLTLLIDMATA